MIKNVISWVVLAAVLAIAGVTIYHRYQETRSCAQPVAYAVGAVDPRFDVSSSTVVVEAQAAASVWNRAAGKTVLVYDAKAPLKVNLVYDEREAATELGSAIARAQAALDSQRAALESKQSNLESKQTAYNQKVAEVNARGGATSGESRTLDVEREELSALGRMVNDSVARFNASVQALNAQVARYNQTAGTPFEEGEYARDSQGERITIFQFISTAQLERVLAHELGHAIGLGHNDDPKSIMYAKNESGNLAPTPADLAALQALCGT